MIPQTLVIKGLYSYQEEQFIDFRNLLEGKLFGIFGSVGSGKSAILEAITFALYGETDRLNSRDNRNYNMMNLKSDELKIDFEFINHDERIFRYTVYGKRHGTDFDNVRTYQRKAYEKKDGDWVPVDVTTTPEITGLTYENFRRTIIIPQGKFQEFLQLSDKERTNMMKELFSLDKFEFFSQTAALEGRTKEQKSNLEGKLSHYEEVSPEAVKSKEAEVQELEAKLKQHLAILNKHEEKVQHLEKLKELYAGLLEKQKQAEALRKQEGAYTKRKEVLEKYEKARNDFGNLLQRDEEIRKEINRKQKDIEKVAGELKEKNGKLEEVQKAHEKAEKAFQQIETRRKELADLKEWMRALEAGEQIKTLAERITAGEVKIQDARKNKEQQDAALKTLDEELDKMKAAMPDQSVLMEVQTWFTQKNTLDKKVKELVSDIEATDKKRAAKHNEYINSIPEELRESIGEAEEGKLHAVLKTLKEIAEKLEQEISKLDNELEHLQLQSKLESYAAGLEEGKPCPLCGATEHPDVLDAAGVDAALKDIRKKKEQVKQQLMSCNNAIADGRVAESTGQHLLQQKEEQTQRLKDTRHQVQAHLESFRWKSYRPDNEKALQDDIKRTQDMGARVKNMEQQRKETENKLRQAGDNLEQYEKLLTDIRDKRTAAETRYNNALSRLTVFATDELPSGKQEVVGKISKLEAGIKKTESDYKSLDRQLRQLNEEVLKLSTTLDHYREEQKKLKAIAEELAATIQNKLEASDFEDVGQVAEWLSQHIDIGKERNEIEAFRQRLYAAEQDLKTAQQLIEGREFDEETYQKAVTKLKDLKQEEEQFKGQLITLQNALKQLKESLELKKKMQQELQNLEKRAENLKTMKQLFKGSGFVNYISSVYLRNLCDAANERFYKLTRQQLQLEVDDNNNFRVRDFLNNGHTRSVKTLSGGQTFQASLSLALALAGSVQQQTVSGQNFFFLDEGFGTLDRESLQTVFNTLKSLRKENRIVGVISHVEEMQQEIDMFIKVTKDDEKGSKVHPSW